jgi:hypothetical protein
LLVFKNSNTEEVRLLHLHLFTNCHFHLLISDVKHNNRHFEISVISAVVKKKEETNKFLESIVREDENYMHHLTPYRKQARMQWKNPTSLRAKK